MASDAHRGRRAYGTGSIYEKHSSYYGTWWVHGKRVNRKLGPIRRAHTKDGLTKAQAEARLRRLMEQVKPTTPVERLTFDDVANRHIDRLEILGRKPSTIADYRTIHRVHLKREFGTRDIRGIKRADVDRFQARLLRLGKKPKTVRNIMAFLHGIMNYAVREEMMVVNAASLVEKPKVVASDPDLKFLKPTELQRVIAEVPDDALGRMERVLYLTAAMTGLRQGEVLGLRWMDVDWRFLRIRVRQSYSRGKKSTPKSKHSYRSVKLSTHVARELEWHFQRSCHQADSDLVFCHPETGHAYDRSKCLKRFKLARDAARVTPVTFHGLRHTYGTEMARNGARPEEIQKAMGHRDIQTTMAYNHYSPTNEREEELAEKIARGLGSKSGSNVPSHARL